MELTEEQTDCLAEIVNIGVGRAAASLSDLIKERVELCVPHLEICSLNGLSDRINGDDEKLDISVVQDFSGGVSGRALLCFPKRSGIKLAQVLSGDDTSTDELDLELMEILEEVGNIVLNGVLGTIGNVVAEHQSQRLEYSVPKLHAESQVAQLVSGRMRQDQYSVLMADTRFDVGAGRITGSLVILFNLGCIEAICDLLLARQAV